MDTVHKLEVTIAGWYRNMPHLPKGGRQWLADNAWWLVLIGVILSVFGLFGIISVLFLAGAGLTIAGGAMGGAYGAAAGAALSGVLWISALVSLVVYAIEVVLMAMAISPLKVHGKRGWDLIFMVFLLNVISVIVTGVLGFGGAGLMGIIWGLLWAAVGAYFLFEVRSYFGVPSTGKHAKKHEPVTAKE
jgi:hypothetical protein